MHCKSKLIKTLEKIYTQALCHDDIVAISIGTRPDCIDEDNLDLINKFTKKYDKGNKPKITKVLSQIEYSGIMNPNDIYKVYKM